MFLRSRMIWLALVSLLSCLAAFVNLFLIRDPSSQVFGHSLLGIEHTYIGDDYPELWDINSDSRVAMLVEETRFYPIEGGDAQELWATSSPKGFGYVRLGAEERAFAVSMFHQLHCTRLMRAALAGSYDTSAKAHMQHCLNYIRQMTLCSPDLTLEPANVLSRNFEVERAGATHVCADWSALYTAAAKNWDVFAEGKNLTSTQ
ncbi:Hydrolase-4 domain-containing protein [Mycena venus]|uniref:Hydrolase-4 domain-containing protein n=1 Tax=Mycena venus TaxID=2733690 RepID=A0A8H6XS29_9AGAR|nr:Hydrolase-4 domain-containing protein [Mycena venus]